MSDLRTMTWLVVWMLGMVVALLTGNAALYVILSALYFGSRSVARLRSRRDRPAPELEP